MKKSVLIFFCLLILPVSASEYSKFAEKNYARQCNLTKAHITVKMEFIEKYAQEIGDCFYPYIAYGYGDLKSKNCKKQRISYFCLLDCNQKPVWSNIVVSK